MVMNEYGRVWWDPELAHLKAYIFINEVKGKVIPVQAVEALRVERG
jgi:hypothetical protein